MSTVVLLHQVFWTTSPSRLALEAWALRMRRRPRVAASEVTTPHPLTWGRHALGRRPFRTSARQPGTQHCEGRGLEEPLPSWPLSGLPRLAAGVERETCARREETETACGTPRPRPPGGWWVAMDRYLNNCYKAAQAAASKAAARSRTANREQCGSVSGGQSVILLFLAPGLGLGREGGWADEKLWGRTQQRRVGPWSWVSGSQTLCSD